MPIGQKLLNLREYHRPAAEGGDLKDALDLLARDDVHTVPLAGGDTLLGSGDQTVEAVVDLQGLGLDRLDLLADPPAVRIGALVTRSALVDWPLALDGENHPDQVRLVSFLASAARRWGGNVQRNRATAGGAIVAAAGNDALVAALLVCDASLRLQTPGASRTVPLGEFLSRRDELLAEPTVITEIVVPVSGGAVALETVSRTPSDAPIVLAAACTLPLTVEATRGVRVRVALGGVAPAPLLAWSGLAGVENAHAIAEEIAAGVDAHGDFRGSAEYRRAMARVLSERVLAATLQGVR